MSAASLLLLGATLVSAPPLTVPPPEPLSGIVVDRLGRPVPGAEVFRVGAATSGLRVLVLWKGWSDGQGRFRADLANRSVHGQVSTYNRMERLYVHKAGMRLAGLNLSRYITKTSPEEPARIVLQPAKAVRVRVIGPDKKPIAGATVRSSGVFGGLRLADELAERFAATTDADGWANIPDSSPEDAAGFNVDAQGFGTQCFAAWTLTPGEKVLALRDVGRVVGQVVADEPERARGIRVRGTVWADTNQGSSAHFGTFEAVSDADGRFEVPEVAIGNLSVFKSRPALDLMTESVGPIAVEAGKTADVRIVVRKGVPVRGVAVLKGTDRPIAGLSFWLESRPDGGEVGLQTDESGRYEGYLRPGRVSASRSGPGPYLFASADVVEMATLPDGAKSLDLPPLEFVRGVDVRGAVRDADGQPVPGASVEAIRADGRIVVQGFFGSPDLLTDRRGEFVLPAMRPGVPLEISASKDEAASGPPTPISPDATVPILVTIGSGGTISLSGRVVDERGKPIAGATVSVASRAHTSMGAEVLRHSVTPDLHTDAEGRFRTPRVLLRHRDHRFGARAPGRRSGQSRWFAPTTPSFFEIALDPAPPPEQAGISAEENAGWAAIDRKDYPEAERRFASAVSRAETQGLGNFLERALWLEGLAEARLALCHTKEAEALARRVVDLREQAGVTKGLAYTRGLLLLARTCEQAGKFNEAEAQTRAALALIEQSSGSDHPDAAEALGLLGSVELAQGAYDEAQADLGRGIAMTERIRGKEAPRLSLLLMNRAIALAHLGRREEAEPLFRRAVRAAEKEFGPAHPLSAECRAQLAKFLHDSVAVPRAEAP